MLALNFGSASLKATRYSLSDDDRGAGPIEYREVGRVSIETRSDSSTTIDENAETLLAEILDRMPELHDPPTMVAHRIVHGGDRPGPIELTPEALTELAGLSALAPLHQPPALALAQAATQRWPSARQFGVFDTSWHRTMPERHRVLPIPYSLYSRGVKRYGFHGLAFQSAMRQLVRIDPIFARNRVVLAHLGGGSSLSAVLDGSCVNTSMSMTPLDGVPMSTRSGSLDPGVLLHLQRTVGMSPDAIDQLFWRESGLLGLSEESGDMRQLLASGSVGARRAVDGFVSSVAQCVAAMAACIGGIDGLAFSGGIGLHASEIRARMAGELAWLGLRIDPTLNQANAPLISSRDSSVKTFVLQIDEEFEMVAAVTAAAGYRSNK